MSSSRRPGPIAVGLFCSSLAACGGGSSPTAAPSPTLAPAPTPLPPVVVAQRTGYSLPAHYIAWLPFPTNRAGDLETTVDWTAAANDLNVYLVSGECSYDQLVAGQCRVLAAAEGQNKPEKFRYQSAQASTYTIFIDNSGPGDESVSFQVVLTASVASVSLPRPSPVDDARTTGVMSSAPR